MVNGSGRVVDAIEDRWKNSRLISQMWYSGVIKSTAKGGGEDHALTKIQDNTCNIQPKRMVTCPV